MEESLKKLKKVRERGGAGGQGQNKPGTQGLSDDDKIRVQLYIDVMYFIRLVWLHVKTFANFKSGI